MKMKIKIQLWWLIKHITIILGDVVIYLGVIIEEFWMQEEFSWDLLCENCFLIGSEILDDATQFPKITFVVK